MDIKRLFWKYNLRHNSFLETICKKQRKKLFYLRKHVFCSTIQMAIFINYYQVKISIANYNQCPLGPM